MRHFGHALFVLLFFTATANANPTIAETWKRLHFDSSTELAKRQELRQRINDNWTAIAETWFRWGQRDRAEQILRTRVRPLPTDNRQCSCPQCRDGLKTPAAIEEQ